MSDIIFSFKKKSYLVLSPHDGEIRQSNLKRFMSTIKKLERIRFSSNQNIGEGESNFDDKYVEKCSTGQSFNLPK